MNSSVPAKHPPLLLASASPRRHDILKQLGIPHHVIQVPSPEGEDEPRLPGEAPRTYVQRTAREKALHAARWLESLLLDGRADDERLAAHIDGIIRHSYPEDTDARVEWPSFLTTGSPVNPARTDVPSPKGLILTADTTVALGDDILGKPQDTDDAIRTLTRMSGKTHVVYTAVTLYKAGQTLDTISISTVRFKTLTAREIEAYCATGEHMGKAGSYGIQGPAAAFVAHMEGSYTGIVGLPAYETSRLLAEAGYRWY